MVFTTATATITTFNNPAYCSEITPG